MPYALEHPFLTAIILIFLICVTGDVFIAFAKRKGYEQDED
jgi:hypothetical protein